ncbi:hypothetical protein BGW36DRAFT_430292 [Talaromyces proteolyticus]|uniref:Uncharacterized protein n=1 Tax=Talaromyces proteolyticus TaxID=1131652 RepID=A0AAD4KQF2_9EURO|nr:uncharacterized protein BGW36DRAFT_430292 [Talaromyces proteolyticus]KAH8694278.1 hypothetical protein BGW36DRAFT_430292 [Talaromyces proteolyticus]
MKGTPGFYFLGLLGLCLTILTSVTGRDTTNVPPELAVIGSPNWILPTTFSSSLGDCEAGHDVVVSPGEYLKPDETQKLPHISIANLMMSYESNTNSKSKYVVLMVDPDYNTTSPTYVILHTLYANVTAQGQLDTSAEIAKYLAP